MLGNQLINQSIVRDHTYKTSTKNRQFADPLHPQFVYLSSFLIFITLASTFRMNPPSPSLCERHICTLPKEPFFSPSFLVKGVEEEVRFRMLFKCNLPSSPLDVSVDNEGPALSSLKNCKKALWSAQLLSSEVDLLPRPLTTDIPILANSSDVWQWK